MTAPKLIIACCGLLLAAGLPGCGTQKECASDEDCPYPESCVKGTCLDDSCPGGCPAGEYCSNGGCYTCYGDQHCGEMCIDCTQASMGESCIWFEPQDYWDCGCYGDWGCADGLCCANYRCVICP